MTMLPAITPTEAQLATAVLRAAELRENSYDTAAADAATIKYNADEAEFKKHNPDSIYYGVPDYSTFYTLILEEACEQAAAEGPGIGIGQLIHLALDGWWNDTIAWANKILDPTATTPPTSKNCQHGYVYKTHDSADKCKLPEDDKDECTLCEAFYNKQRIIYPESTEIPSWATAMVSKWPTSRHQPKIKQSSN